VKQQTESHEDAFVLPLVLAFRVCDNVNMRPRIAAILRTCGGRAPAQFPGCAYMLTGPCPFSVDPQEACQDCPPGAQVFYVENFRKDGQVKVTIRVELWDVVPGNSNTQSRCSRLQLIFFKRVDTQLVLSGI